mmetsp:Transcript_12502/g.34506  ORF Transcript_12502/g.34506 Transcript_12502/m.34506 type:complete len:228 (-) Transcript_12502:4947-5630(-)
MPRQTTVSLLFGVLYDWQNHSPFRRTEVSQRRQEAFSEEVVICASSVPVPQLKQESLLDIHEIQELLVLSRSSGVCQSHLQLEWRLALGRLFAPAAQSPQGVTQDGAGHDARHELFLDDLHVGPLAVGDLELQVIRNSAVLVDGQRLETSFAISSSHEACVQSSLRALEVILRKRHLHGVLIIRVTGALVHTVVQVEEIVPTKFGKLSVIFLYELGGDDLEAFVLLF